MSSKKIIKKNNPASAPAPASHAPLQVLSAECPMCHQALAIIQVPETIPLFGQIVIQTMRCSHCSYKFSDVMSVEFRGPIGFEARIEEEKDLHTKLVRNSSGTVEIPELGFLLEPGPMAEGFYTNMEGLLERVDGILKYLSSNADSEKQKSLAKELLQKSLKFRAGKLPFTVIVKDPFGGSALIGQKVTKFNISEKEAHALKHGVMVMDKPAASKKKSKSKK